MELLATLREETIRTETVAINEIAEKVRALPPPFFFHTHPSLPPAHLHMCVCASVCLCVCVSVCLPGACHRVCCPSSENAAVPHTRWIHGMFALLDSLLPHHRSAFPKHLDLFTSLNLPPPSLSLFTLWSILQLMSDAKNREVLNQQKYTNIFGFGHPGSVAL